MDRERVKVYSKYDLRKQQIPQHTQYTNKYKICNGSVGEQIRLLQIQMKYLVSKLTQPSGHSQTEDWGNVPFVLSILSNCLWPIAWLYCNENKISFADSTACRGIVSLVAGYAGCIYTQDSNAFSFKHNLRLVVIRSVLMTFHSFFTGLAQFILQLPIVHTIACSGCLFIFIIDYFINGTEINKKQTIGIIVGIFGVFLASNGRLFTQWINPEYAHETTYHNYLLTDPVHVSIFTLFYCLVIVGWAYGFVITRMAKAHTFQINFILGLVFYFSGNLALPFMQSLGYSSLSFGQSMMVIMFTGVPCFVVQMLVIAALTMTKQTGVLSLMSFSSVLVSFLISIFYYHESANLICMAGVVLVIGGCTQTILNTAVK